MENGGQRGWDEPCTPCPVKGTGKLNCAVESLHSEEEATVLPLVALCYTHEIVFFGVAAPGFLKLIKVAQ